MIFLKQSTAADVMLGPFIDDTDGKTTEEALTLAQADLQLSKNGGAAAQKNDATAGTHRYSGNYMIDLNATDTGTLGVLRLMCKESGALPVIADFMVVTANWYDTMCSTDILQSDLTQMGGVAQSATDLKDFADAGYDPATNKVQGVALTDTCTTNTDLISGFATEAKQDIIDTNIDQIEAAVITNAAGVDIAADIIAVQADLDNGTDGLGALKALIDALNDLSAADVNAQMLDVLNVDTFAEPGDEAPVATTTLVNKVGYLYKFLRNKVETTSTRVHIYDDAGTNKDQSSVISDDGSIFTRGEFAAGDA